MPERADRRFLVLSRAGDKSLHKTWIADSSVERNWDLQLNAYGKDESRVQDGDLPTVIDRGTKFDSIARHFRNNPDLLERYDYIAIPDDDLLLSPQAFNRVFEIATEYDLSVAQPSLSLNSYLSHPIVMNVPGFKLRYSNFVEGMACCFKSSYLKRLLPLLENYSTGWGVDLVWTMTMEHPEFRSAVIDEVQVTHTRPMHTGPLYAQLRREKRSPKDDVKKLASNFRNAPRAMFVYGGVLADGREVDGAETMRRNSAHLLKIAHQSPAWIHAYRFGAVMAVRSVTRSKYLPQTLEPTTAAPLWLMSLF
ncbi:MAG: hypothetical protein ABWZ40_05210 [Caulobacterales bacterium]